MSDQQTQTKSPPASALPLFYGGVEALSVVHHGGLSLARQPDYAFARVAHAIPIAATEMPAVMRSYPIVFVGEQRNPVAIVGLRASENLFVEDDGSWARPHYVPAYVRRYPFILADDGKNGRMTLCIDRASDRLVDDYAVALGEEGTTTRLFEDKEPTKAVTDALKFCEKLQREFLATRAMVEKIAGHDLFAPRRSTVTLEGGEVLSLTDFQVVDENKLNALPDEAFLALRKSGALALIYCHLASSNSWNALVHQAALRKARAAGGEAGTRTGTR